MVSTSNYVARGFGVRSAMPTHMARELCPGLVVLPVDMEKYKEASERFLSIIEEYDADFESQGLDEASIEISEYMAIHGMEGSEDDVMQVMGELRRKVQEEIGITASSGYASNAFLAKICSEQNKPNGQFYLPKERGRILDFVGGLDIRKLPGIGPQSEDILKGLGIHTGKEMRERLFDLFVLFGDYVRFLQYAYKCNGMGRTAHEEKKEKKSFNMSRTIRPTRAVSVLLGHFEDIARKLTEKLKSQGKVSRHVGVKIKFNDFRVVEKSSQAIHAMEDAEGVFERCSDLFSKVKIVEAVRLVGVCLSDLSLKGDHKEDASRTEKAQVVPLTNYFRKSDGEKEEALGVEKGELSRDKIDIENGGIVNLDKVVVDEEIMKEIEEMERQMNEPLDEENSNDTNIKSDQMSTGLVRIDRKNKGEKCISLEDEKDRKGGQTDVTKQLDGNDREKGMLGEYYMCPVCHQSINIKHHLSLLNKHIDMCLNTSGQDESREQEDGQTIDDIMNGLYRKRKRQHKEDKKEENEHQYKTMKKAGKNPPSSHNGSMSKKSSGGVASHSHVSIQSIDTYFMKK